MLKVNTKFLLSGLQILIAMQSKAGVYSQGIYASGTTYYDLCSISLPLPPNEFKLTELNWYEDVNGYIVMDVNKRGVPGIALRRILEVESGTNRFIVPLDSFVPDIAWSRENAPVTKGSGDLAHLVTQCATNRGGRISTNPLPVIQANWIRQSRATQDIIVVDGDHFAEVQRLLELAFSKPGPGIVASAAAGVNGHSLTYTPDQIGVFLNLTVAWRKETIVSIIEKPEP